jgi:fructosamine-3-kinase
MQIDWTQIAAHITEISGQPFTLKVATPVSGGCINQAWCVQGLSGTYFVKLNSTRHLEMFAAELAGLQAIAATGSIRVPQPVCCGTTENHFYLVLEYLDLGQFKAGRSDVASEQLGEQLAVMHRCTASRFGWQHNNTIGVTPQINSETEDWATFWAQHRLGYQLELAARNGYHGRLQQRGQQLLNHVHQLLASHRPQPSLVHGDLWSGNYAVTAGGQPVIFDPAPYYGDRETDLAMTELFGGFSPRFYAAYCAAWPLADGYQVRKDLYNLYHILNHLNLFGDGYRKQAEGMIDRLLSEPG